LHLVNLTGLKKRDSIEQRLIYANEIMEDILDSADNPLTVRLKEMESMLQEVYQGLLTLPACILNCRVEGGGLRLKSHGRHWLVL